MTLKRTIKLLKEYLRMNNISVADTTAEPRFLERSALHLELTDANKYRLDEINKIKEYFDNEIKERKDIIKKLNKYLVSFDYLDEIFITLSASFGTLSIASYAAVVGIPVGITGSSLTSIFTIGTGINKSLLKVAKKRKKKHNKIIALAKSKLNMIDTLLSSALNDSKISHEEFTNVITEKNIYENIKENIKDTAGSSSLERSHFRQNVASIPNNGNVINIYCVYKLDSIASNRDDTFTIQNALFGAMQIAKNTDTSKYNYKGYCICFDEGGQFGHSITEGGFAHTTNARNVLIFGADMSFSTHPNNRANNIYVMGELFIQGINDTTIYAEKKLYRNFTDPSEKFILSLHYNGDDSYLFVNGRQELKFKCKTDQLVKEKLCIGNLSDQWTTSESEKTGLYGNIYDFVIDYEEILGVKAIYDIHRYLMTKHNISP